MKNRIEDDDTALLESGPLEITVPGLFEILTHLRTMYPVLSEESLARILGLPVKKGPIRKRVVAACGEGQVER